MTRTPEHRLPLLALLIAIANPGFESSQPGVLGGPGTVWVDEAELAVVAQR